MRHLLLLVVPALLGCPHGPAKDPAKDRDTADDTGDTDTVDTADSDSADSDSGDTETGDSDTSEPDTSDTAPPPTDADGDGYSPTEEGGDDCDDANALIHPGATEYCDTVDQDCDGEPLVTAGCGVAAPADASGYLYIRSASIGVVSGVVRDLTGDGQPDLEALADNEGMAFVFAGGTLPATPYTLTPGEAWSTLDPNAVESSSYVKEGGDLDGDGAPDMLLGDEFGGAIARPGPLPGPGDVSSAWQEGSVQYPGYIQTDAWQLSMSGTDLDGDGRADFLAMNPSNGTFDRFPSDIHYQLYFGGEPDTRCDVRADIDGDASWAGQAAAIGDGDGDGLPEFGYWTHEGGYIVSGADARLLCDSYSEDVAGATISGPAAGGVHESLGDWDGDGYAEWPLVDETANTGETAIYLLSSTVAFAGALDLVGAPSSFVTPTNRDFEFADALDFDGDGTKDLVLTEDYGYQVRVIRGGFLPGPNEPFPDRHLLFLHAGTDGPVGAYMHGGDLDGDGREDMLAWHGLSDDDPMFNVRVILGFDVPWDDPEWWGE